MLKNILIIFVFICSSYVILSAQSLRRLPLPDDLSQPVLSPTTTTPSEVQKSLPLPTPPVRPTSIPVSAARTTAPATRPQVSREPESYTTESRPSDKSINPNFIDENMQNFNQLTNTIFESLRMQYNYILKLETDINDLREAMLTERQRFAEEQRVLNFNIEKLEEQNASYLQIFDKLRNDNYALEEHINRLEEAMNAKDNRINQLEDAVNTMQQRLMQIRNLTDF